MPVSYDKHDQTENLFREPYPELIGFFAEIPKKGAVLDLGCGQGRVTCSLTGIYSEVNPYISKMRWYSVLRIRNIECNDSFENKKNMHYK